jgi:hypothetical protein
MSDPVQPQLVIRHLPGYQQVSVTAVGQLEVVYDLNGQEGRSVGEPFGGVPIPFGATIKEWQIRP